MKDVYIAAAATLIASLPAPGDGHGGANLAKMAESVVTLANELSRRLEKPKKSVSVETETDRQQ